MNGKVIKTKSIKEKPIQKDRTKECYICGKDYIALNTYTRIDICPKCIKKDKRNE